MFLLGLEIVITSVMIPACSYELVSATVKAVDEAINDWLSVATTNSRAEALVLKNEFQRAEVKPANVVRNHTHGESAADRSSGSLLIKTVALGVCKTPYYYQGSGSDHRSGRAYSRKYFWAKDLMAPAKPMLPGRKDIIAMVDVVIHVNHGDNVFPSR